MNLKSKTILIIMTLFTLCYNARSQQATKEEAVQMALLSLSNEKDFSIDTIVDTIYIKKVDGYNLLYEVCFSDSSMVLISGNKSCIPVLGMSSENKKKKIKPINLFDDDNEIPDGLKYLINCYIEQISYCFQKNNKDCGTNKWIIKHDSKANRRVSPLIDSEWGQTHTNDNAYNQIEHAYNYYVIESGDYCEYCLAGCGPVAMAQIMRYWGHPQDIPFRAYQFDWNNMPDKLKSSHNNNYIVERDAVAKLIRDCGLKSYATYCKTDDYYVGCGTSTHDDTLKMAFNKFGYDCVLLYRDSVNNWVDIMINELDNSRPMVYLGSSPSNGGHAFVCDGYKQNISGNYLFHFNWGWNGNEDNFYSIDNLSPYLYDFSQYQRMICNIQPTSCWDTIIMECNKTFSSIATYLSAKNKIENNFHTFAFTGCYAELTAGEEIFLTNGFSVNEGTIFDAYIAPCGSSTREDGHDVQKEDTRLILDGIEENAYTPDNIPNLTLHPNPTTGLVSIVLPNNVTIRQIEIRNLLGTLALEKTNMQGNTLDVSSLPAGVYIVQVVTSEGKEVFAKLVKK